MDQFTHHLITWIGDQPPVIIYAVFFGVAYFENVIPPIPGDIIVVFAGYLAARDIILLFPVYALTTIASVAGFMTMYTLGRYWGDLLDRNQERSWFTRMLDVKYMPKVRAWMNRWGLWVVTANRFLSGARSVISITAGMSRMEVRGTVLGSLISSLLWNALLIGAGWEIQQNWHIIGHYLSVYSRIITIAIILAVIVKVIWGVWRKKKTQSLD
ncbi:MAG TPA: DedA family protein [Balneolales bacterium]|nr:DedA family protein [Balneolales bacterium]